MRPGGKASLRPGPLRPDCGDDPAVRTDEVCRRGQGVRLDQGLDTMLGREFDGAELSGGQWQRVAIGRGLFRPSDFIVLDEPTSAIDPLQETRLYQEFMEICRDKTAVIVTHRLGSVKIADRIVVLKDGCLAEEGTHEELMALGGEYKCMFDAQSQWYD